MRRVSSRKRKQRTFFVAGPSKRVGLPDSQEDDEQPSSDEDDQNLTPNREKPRSGRYGGRKGTPGTASTSQRSPSTSQRTVRANQPKDSEEVAALKDPNCSLVQLVNDLLRDVDGMDELATRLVQIAMESAGASVSVVESSFGTDMMMDEVTEDAVFEFVRDVAKDEASSVEQYPVVHVHGFAKTIKKFWKLVVEEGGEILLNDVLSGSSTTEELVEALALLSAQPLIAFRHTGTICCGAFGAGLIQLINAQVTKLYNVMKQLNSRIDKERLGDHFKNLRKGVDWFCLPKENSASMPHGISTKDTKFSDIVKKWKLALNNGEGDESIKQLTESLERLGANVTHLLTLMDILWRDVIAARFRDIYPVVRIAALQTVGEWVHLDPVRFLERGKHFVEKSIGDKEPAVRESACKMVAKCYAAQSPYGTLLNDEEIESQMNALFRNEKVKWGKRGVPDVEYLLGDENPTVATAAIHAMTAVFRADRALVKKVCKKKIAKCLCLDDASQHSIREEAAKFVVQVHFASPENGDDEEQPTPGSIVRARLKISTLFDVISKHILGNTCTEEDEENGDEEDVDDDDDDDEDNDDDEDDEKTKAINLTISHDLCLTIVESLWNLPECAFLRNWGAFASMLQSYGENEIKGNIGELKSRTLAAVFLAAATCANEDPLELRKGTHKPSRRQMQQLKNQQEETLDRLFVALNKSLADLLHVFRTDSQVLSSLVPLVEFIEPSKLVKDSDRRGFEKLVKTLANLVPVYTDANLLDSISDMLLTHICFGEEHPVQEFALETVKGLANDIVQDILGAATIVKKDCDSQEPLIRLTNGMRRLHFLMRKQSNNNDHQFVTRAFDEQGHSELMEALNHVMSEFYIQGSQDRDIFHNLVNEGLLLLQIYFTCKFVSIATKMKAAKDDDDDPETILDPVRTELKTVVSLRDELARFVHSVVSDERDTEECKIAALLVYHDLRLLCTSKLKETVLYALAWTPNLALETKFENFTSRILFPPRKEDDENDGVEVIKKTTTSTSVIAPIIRTLLFTDKVDGSEEKIAGQLLRCIISEESTELVKAAKIINNAADDTEAELAQYLAKTISSRQKMCPVQFSQPVMKLLGQGIEFSLQTPSNLDFLNLMIPYVKLLKATQMANLRTLWTEHVGKISQEIADVIFPDNKRKETAFTRFEKVLGVQTKPKDENEKTEDKAMSEDEDDREETKSPSPPQKRKQSTTRASSNKKRKSNENQEEDDDSIKHIEKSLFESDSESVKAKNERKAPVQPAKSPKDASQDPLFNDEEEETNPETTPMEEDKNDNNDNDDEEEEEDIGFRRRRSRRRSSKT